MQVSKLQINILYRNALCRPALWPYPYVPTGRSLHLAFHRNPKIFHDNRGGLLDWDRNRWRLLESCWGLLKNPYFSYFFLSLSDLWLSIGEQFLTYVNSWSWLDEKLCLLGFLLVCYNAWHVLESCLCRIERKPHFWCCNICHNIGRRLILKYVIQNDQSWNVYKL